MASVMVPGFAALKSVLEGLKGAGSVLREADKIPQYEAVLNAYAQMSEMQGTIYELQEKLRETEKELTAMRALQASVEGSKIDHQLLWLKGDNEPRCLHCWDADKKLIHVNRGWALSQCYSRCPRCKEQLHGVPGPNSSVW
jgi:hypothetical protein